MKVQPPKFIELAGEINSQMPKFVVNKVSNALNDVKKSVNGSTILVLGVSYKRDIDDTRESPALDIISLLKQKGAKVFYHDPYVNILHENGITMKSKPLTPKSLGDADCVIIATDHSEFDYKFVTKHSKIIVDTRNATNGIKSKKITRL